MKDFYTVLMRQCDRNRGIRHIARQFGFSECPDSFDVKYGKNKVTIRFQRPADEHYPEMEFFIQEYPEGVCYGISSVPYDARYHRHVSPSREQNPEELRDFLSSYS